MEINKQKENIDYQIKINRNKWSYFFDEIDYINDKFEREKHKKSLKKII